MDVCHLDLALDDLVHGHGSGDDRSIVRRHDVTDQVPPVNGLGRGRPNVADHHHPLQVRIRVAQGIGVMARGHRRVVEHRYVQDEIGEAEVGQHVP